MFAEISRISQDIDLKTGASSFFIVLTLPTGKVVRASIAAEDAQILLTGSADDTSAPPDMTQPEPEYEPPPWARGELPASAPSTSVPEGAFVFGGQDTPVDEPPAPPPVQQPQRKPQRRMTTVPKDEMGYPIIRNGAVDPGEVVGHSGDPDEEGIGQG